MKPHQAITITLLVFLLFGSCTQKAKERESFYVKGAKIFAPNGEEFIARGVNKMIFYQERSGKESYREIAKTGANIVRIFWFTKGTSEELDETLSNCVANNMVAMPAVWEATGKWENLQQCVDYWSREDILAVIEKYKKYVLLNIANEAGNHEVTSTEYRDTYQNAVLKLRNAGLTVPLVIDAAGWGRRESDILDHGNEILKADPLQNLIFSWHQWDSNIPQSRIKETIDEARNKNLAFIIGEFAPMEVGCKCCIDYKYILDYCEETGTGWMAWSWGPGNGDCPDMDMTEDNTIETLHGWGFEVALSLKNSIQNTSQRPCIFPGMNCN